MTVDPFTLLEKDHRHVERLLEALGESEAGEERDRLLAELDTASSVHMAFEEEAVYPLVRAELDEESAEEADIEHGLARDGLAKLHELAHAPGFGAAVEMLTGGIGHHVEEEEGEMFPALRKQVDAEAGARLRASLGAAKQAAGLPPIDMESATKDELVQLATDAGLDLRSDMTKDELKAALAG